MKMHMETLTNEEAIAFGLTTLHNRMPSGELRFRLVSSDGSVYARTESRDGSGWQQSHSHSFVKEMYIVQKGWVIFAEYIDGDTCMRRYSSGDYFLSSPGVVHNVYLAADTVIHTVKFGDTSSVDWIASPEFDEVTRDLKEENFGRYLGNS